MSRMKLARSEMLRGMYGRDRALDGRYLVAVQTTRIYCLPSCHNARRIQPRHRVPFRSAAEGVAAGYRACRECRPTSGAALAA